MGVVGRASLSLCLCSGLRVACHGLARRSGLWKKRMLAEHECACSHTRRSPAPSGFGWFACVWRGLSPSTHARAHYPALPHVGLVCLTRSSFARLILPPAGSLRVLTRPRFACSPVVVVGLVSARCAVLRVLAIQQVCPASPALPPSALSPSVVTHSGLGRVTKAWLGDLSPARFGPAPPFVLCRSGWLVGGKVKLFDGCSLGSVLRCLVARPADRWWTAKSPAVSLPTTSDQT